MFLGEYTLHLKIKGMVTCVHLINGRLVPYRRALELQGLLVRSKLDRLHRSSNAAASVLHRNIYEVVDSGPGPGVSIDVQLVHALAEFQRHDDIDILLLLEHTPVYTAGRRLMGKSGGDAHEYEGERLRRETGAEYYEVD
jgi:hypothetical protein